jgi:hypothetical protein
MEFGQFPVRTNQMEACDMMDATDALSVSLPSADVHLAEHHIHDEDKVASEARPTYFSTISSSANSLPSPSRSADSAVMLSPH